MKKIILILIICLMAGAGFIYFFQSPLNKTVGSDKLPSPEEQSLVADYLSQNISRLSPEKEVLGGKFYITKIIFKDAKTGQVEYEDGHIALKAEFVYLLKNNQVAITSFKLWSQKERAEEFKQVGNLVREEGADGWLFIYEEPGKPALRLILVIDKNSQCWENEQVILCDSLEIGARAEIFGEKLKNKIMVKTLKIIK